MTDRIRTYHLRCTSCDNVAKQKTEVSDLPGGVRRYCRVCATLTVKISTSLHHEEPELTYCQGCNEWSGRTDRCGRCGVFVTEVEADIVTASRGGIEVLKAKS